MRVLLLWPSHTSSTFDVAHGYRSALGRLSVPTADFIYSDELVLQNLAINAFRGSKEMSYEGESILLSNRMLMGYIASSSPDVIIVVCGLDISKSAWKWMWDFRKNLKKPYKIISIFTESPYRPSEELELASWSDYVFTNERTYVSHLREIQPKTWYMPQAYDDRRHKPEERDPQHDVYLCGSGFRSRVHFLEQIDWESIGVDLTLKGLWRDITEGTPLYPYYQAGFVKNEKVTDDYRASKICLNVHRQEGEVVVFERDTPQSYSRERALFKVQDAWSMNNRTCEIAATGAFQLVDDSRAEVAEVFGESVPRFRIDDAADLQDKVAYYAHRPEVRDKLAQEARMRIEGRTYLSNMKRILNLIGG